MESFQAKSLQWSEKLPTIQTAKQAGDEGLAFGIMSCEILASEKMLVKKEIFISPRSLWGVLLVCIYYKSIILAISLTTFEMTYKNCYIKNIVYRIYFVQLVR